MKHSISYDDWLGYLDGALPPPQSNHIRAHLETCVECRNLYEELLAATATLRAAGESYRERRTLNETAVRSARKQVWSRIRAAEASGTLEDLAGPVLSLNRLRRLQALVAPVCGARTAFRLILAAVTGMPAAPEASGCGDDWTCFVRKLKELTSAFCGRTTAMVVWDLGQSLELE
jgi:anti-sigma factor RsiW